MTDKVWTFDEYQTESAKTSLHGIDNFDNILYATLGVAGEAGEVAEKIKKVWRNHNGHFSENDVDAIMAELGDVLWYMSRLADFLGFSMNEVADHNIDKILDRWERNVTKGEGDDR